MIYGLGIDTVEVKRFYSWINNSPKIARFFHPIEVNYIENIPMHRRAASLAARFSAKEAFGKATGLGLAGIRLIDIAVKPHPISFAPQLIVVNTAQKMIEKIPMRYIHLSLTHTCSYATACVIIEKRYE